ncbi:MAG: ETC complex I subunit [Pseudomonadota bacterium]
MQARIHKPNRSQMQAGQGKSKQWVLEFTGAGTRSVDPLMGWTSIDDTQSQVKLTFDTREQAIAYAKREGLTFTVEEPREPKRMVKSYAANFDSDRKRPWTH